MQDVLYVLDCAKRFFDGEDKVPDMTDEQFQIFNHALKMLNKVVSYGYEKGYEDGRRAGVEACRKSLETEICKIFDNVRS